MSAYQAHRSPYLLRYTLDAISYLPIPLRLPGKVPPQRKYCQRGDDKTDRVQRKEMGEGQENDQYAGKAGAEGASQPPRYIHQPVGSLQYLRVSGQRGK